jgi:hypothetical protein
VERTAALSDRSSSSKELPLHKACSLLVEETPPWASEAPHLEAVREVIEYLMDAYPAALWAKHNEGNTLIMAVPPSLDGKINPPPVIRPILLDMIRRGGPRSHWSERVQRNGTRVLKTAVSRASSSYAIRRHCASVC